ncbi:MAG: FAD-linked oxidase C-terminal domain-containing protein, partial [Anaerolineae bacterium]|nr:FAD-linked oxidase C-terminal domain-containing protein [Anaerolineae bacterium]
YDGREPGAYERAEALAAAITRMCIAMGGSITGEHGVGMEKRAFLAEMFSEDDMEAMHRLRLALDPHELANRGKMFPGEPTAGGRPTWAPHPLERAGVISRM